MFNWVIENLIKNAIDAMEGVGSIKVRVFKSSKNVIIDIIDSGKGVPKGKYDIQISSIGYKNILQSVDLTKNINNTFFLEENIRS